MTRNPDPAQAAHVDRDDAERERLATKRLLALGADALAGRPWRPAPIPPSAVDLAHFALSRCADLAPENLSAADIAAALTLLPAARAEVDALETGVLFAARSAGMTWTQIAEAMGFNSPQACQQHFGRLAARQDARR